MLTHKFYLDNSSKDNAKLKRAFLDGCKSMMAVIAHCDPTQISALFSRDDEDWIRFICDQEQERAEAEERAVTAHVLQNYQEIDRQAFRGMILNCSRINDEGLEVDDEGEVCSHQPYPNQTYEYMHDDTYPPRQINNEEYAQLPSEEKDQYMRRSYIELAAHDNKTKRRFSDGRRAFMTIVLEQLLPHEPSAVMDLYRKALEDESSDIIQNYRELFTSALSIRGFLKDFEAWLNDENDDD